ncbi:unnamed protein product, partial [Rotaria magnacalcarata]
AAYTAFGCELYATALKAKTLNDRLKLNPKLQ